MRTIIKNATIVNERQNFVGSVVVENGIITDICPIDTPTASLLTYDESASQVIDATGKYLIPGVIDDHVHFRQPGQTHKGDITTESRAAAAGGVTSYMDMPNTIPATTSIKLLEEKFRMAAEASRVNYSFFFGGTKKNVSEIALLDPTKVCGVKIYMDNDSLGKKPEKQDRTIRQIMETSPVLVMVHCEDRNTIQANIKALKKRFKGQNDFPVRYHSRICDVDACFNAVERAVNIARETGARLHLAQVSSKKELSLLSSLNSLNNNTTPSHHGETTKRITSEACIANLMFDTEDYDWLGPRIKTDPAVKSRDDRDALRSALSLGLIDVVSSDHAPHLLSDKVGGALRAASGIPLIQVALVSMLELVDKGVLTIGRLVELMCHNPARLYGIDRRGFIRKGYHADLVLLDPEAYWQGRECQAFTKCGWTPMDEHTFKWKVISTWVNGEKVFDNGNINDDVRGKRLVFLV